MIMKTKSHRFFALGAVVVNLIAVQMVSSQTERFSASLSGANEVPPINSAGSGDFRMTIRPTEITFSLTFSDLS